MTGQVPNLALEDYFAGKTRAWGLFTDRFGNLRRQFVVDILGRLENQTLTLTEDFTYDDGETETRIWRIRRTGADSYEGKADDVEGKAEGKVFGNMVNWRYRLRLPVGNCVWKVSFDDWMYLQPDDVMINRACVSKFGIRIGEALIVFSKTGELTDTFGPESLQGFVSAAG